MTKRPFCIGVAGGTGSGKTTVAHKLASSLPAGTSDVLEFDAYYLDLAHLSRAERAQVNFDHPDALDTPLLVAHLERLRSGHAIEAPTYDFVKHTRAVATRTISPCPVIVVEGIMTLVAADVRNQLDLKIFVDTDADIRVLRRVRRDIEHRGREFEEIRAQYYETVRPMHLEYVEPSKRHADLIIPEGGDNTVALEVIVARLMQLTTAR